MEVAVSSDERFIFESKDYFGFLVILKFICDFGIIFIIEYYKLVVYY